MIRRLAIALALACALIAPSVARAQSSAELIAEDLDVYWAQIFAERGLPYTSPQLEFVDAPGTNFCDNIDVYYTIAGYCSTNQTIYFSLGMADPNAIFLALPVLSHEFAHHIQNLTDTGITSALESELQADCFAGAFIDYAAESDWISPVIAAMALQLTQSAGDVWWQIPFDEAIHGTQTDRAIAFMAGQSGGLEACGF